MQKNKEFKPFLVDIWSNERYGDKAKAEHCGQVYTLKIAENISENLLSDVISACAKAHLNHDHNTQESTEFNYSFGYEIREMENKSFLVPFYYSLLQEDKPQYYRHIVIKAVDLEEARTKAEDVRMYLGTPKGYVYNLGDADRFDPAMIEEIQPEELKFLISRGTFISYVER